MVSLIVESRWTSLDRFSAKKQLDAISMLSRANFVSQGRKLISNIGDIGVRVKQFYAHHSRGYILYIYITVLHCDGLYETIGREKGYIRSSFFPNL